MQIYLSTQTFSRKFFSYSLIMWSKRRHSNYSNNASYNQSGYIYWLILDWLLFNNVVSCFLTWRERWLWCFTPLSTIWIEQDKTQYNVGIKMGLQVQGKEEVTEMIRTISGLKSHQQRQLVTHGCYLGFVGNCLLCTRSIAMLHHNALIRFPSQRRVW